MKGFSDFLKRMDEEVYQVVKEEESKDLAKEDALALIAEFVKDVKKKFKKDEDQLEILRSASKTLDFYINEIISAGSETDTSTDVGSFDTMETGSDSFDDEDIE